MRVGHSMLAVLGLALSLCPPSRGDRAGTGPQHGASREADDGFQLRRAP